MRGVVPAGLILGAATATALASAGPGALLPFKAALAAADDVSVAFVVDFAGAGVVSACVKVPAADNGYQALAAFTQQENETAPTFNASGLLCSINDDPNTGCGLETPAGYDYWSYWHGATGAWAYASTGAFGTVTNGDVEGWRFEDPGKANPSDPPPGAAPNYSAICGVSVTTTTPVVTTSPPPSPPGTSVSHPTTSATTVAPPPTNSLSPTTLSTSAPRTSDVGPGSVSSSSPQVTDALPLPRTQALGGSRTDDRHAGAGDAVPLVITGAIVAALGAVATIRWRRRPRPS